MPPALAWATDIHLDHCNPETIADFASTIAAETPQALVLTGDLAESHNFAQLLGQLAEQVKIPIYYILGNHDYYHGSIPEVRQHMRQLSQSSPFLRWMPFVQVVELSPQTALVGHDGWSDARHGNFETSSIRLKDYRLIHELAQAEAAGRLQPLLQTLGDEAAAYFKIVLPQVLGKYAQVYLLIHPPPFREACLYGKEVADDNWAPHFTCKAVGDLLLELMPHYPQTQLTVLAGHTHNPCDLQILPNLQVKVGKAEYGAPEVQELLAVV